MPTYSKNIPIIATYILLLATMLLTGCQDQSNQVDALSNQVAALSTQNALLLENLAAPDTSSQGDNTNESQQQTEPTAKPTPLVIPTATPESLPTEPVMAGTPIIYDGWSIMVSKEIDTRAWNGDPQVRLQIFVRNLGTDSRVFRYTNSAITLSDNLGNVYPILIKEASCEAGHFDVKNYTIRGDELVTLKSSYGRDCDRVNNIDSYSGTIPLEVGHLIVTLDGFGPLYNVEVIIDL